MATVRSKEELNGFTLDFIDEMNSDKPLKKKIQD